MFELLVLAAEETGEKEFSPVNPVISELVWAAVFFVVLFIVVSRVALPKLNVALAAREAAVVGRVRAADETKAEADALLADYQARLADAQTEANRIIDEGRRTAEGIVTEARSRAESEAQTILTRAQSDIRAESGRAQTALRSTVAELSIQVAGQVVGQSLDTETQRSLVERYIDELSTTASQN